MLSKVKAALNALRIGELSEVLIKSSNRETSLNWKSTNKLSTDVRYQRDKNEEDVTIVWLSKNTKSTTTQSLITSLRCINDYVRVFDDEDNGLDYIKSIVEEKVLLIVDHLCDNLLNVLKTSQQVDALFLYTSVVPDELPSCLTTFCPTEQKLIDEIKHSRQQLNKQMIIFSIYNQTKKQKFDLTHEAGSFLFFQLFKAAFKKLPKNSESKRLMISKYRDYYEDNAKVLAEITNFEFNYMSNEALRWYTNDSFIYRLINKAFRTENINCLCYFHFYINDLSKQLEKEFIKFKKENSKSLIQLYHAFKTTHEGIKHFERNIDHLILINGYLSATRKRELAYDMSMKQYTKSDEVKVLFECTVDLIRVKTIRFADISQYTGFTGENEILFDLGTVFKIHSCTYNTEENLWLVKVDATDEGVDVTSEYIEYQTAKMTESNIILMFGHLIIELGDYDKAESYFDAILHSSIPNDEEIACIYYNVGRIYRLKGEYKRALEFLIQAYATHSEAQPPRLTSAAKAMNAIGIVYMEQKYIEQAIESFECALELYSKTVQEYHPDIGGTLINLANIYCEQGHYEKALSCFKRAENIYECSLPHNHPNKAILLNNIGNLYYRQFQFDLALNAYRQALTINETILPPNHPDIARNRHNLSLVQTMLSNENKVDSELKQTSECSLFTTQSHMESMKTSVFSSETTETNKTSEPKFEVIEMESI